MATTLTYGDITFANIVTEDFTDEIVRDSESNTDTWFHRYTLVFWSVVNLKTFNTPVNISLGATSNSNKQFKDVAQCEAYILSQLADRQTTWSYQVNGTDLIPPNSSWSRIDCNNGPKILWQRITRLSRSTFEVRGAIQFCIAPCSLSAGTSQPPQILGNRWSQSDDYDESFRCLRTWRGRLRLSTAVVSPQTFRDTVLPPVSDGFKRKHMNLVASENGLELIYSVTDEEYVGEAPPKGAVKMTATQHESFGVTMAKTHGRINVRLDGLPSVTKAQLMNMALQVAIAKMRLKNGNTNRVILQGGVLTNHFSDNVNAVEVALEVEFINTVADSGQVFFANSSIDSLVKPLKEFSLPGYDPRKSTTRDAYGNAGSAGALACALQTPCGDHSFPKTVKTTTAKPDQNTPTSNYSSPATISVGTGSLGVDVSPPDYSAAHLQAPYHASQIDMIYETNQNQIQLPIAASQGSQYQSNQATSVVVSLGPPVWRLRVRASMERVGADPELWQRVSFTAKGKTYTFLGAKTNVRPPLLMANKEQSVAAVDAEYLYAIDIPPGPGGSLSASSLPWTTTTVADDAYPSSAYIQPTNQNVGLA